jgi:hypothetical protein
MASVITAVNTDTYGGLSGFKRPTPGNPTKLGRNLPAFRGVKNTPGSNVKAPPIKSSANRNNRGTNIQIPFARVTPIAGIGGRRDLGRRAPGDVVFVSRDRPGIPGLAPAGYAHARENRLIGVDYLNTLLDNWSEEVDGVRRAIWVPKAGQTMSDSHFRTVPLLNEWTLDGIVLSDDEPGVSQSSGNRDGQLFNIGIQGPCIVNNGYITEQGFGTYSRSLHSLGTSDNQSFNNVGRKNAGGSDYHLYPLQMFDREIGPLQNVFVVLVATTHEVGSRNTEVDQLKGDAATIGKANQQLRQNQPKKSPQRDAQYQKIIAETAKETKKRTEIATLETRLLRIEKDNPENYKESLKTLGPRLDGLKTDLNEILAEITNLTDEMNGMPEKSPEYEAFEAKINGNNATLQSIQNKLANYTNDAFAKAGFTTADGKVKAGTPSVFVSFKYVLTSSAQFWDLDASIDMSSKHKDLMPKKHPRIPHMDNDPYFPLEKQADLAKWGASGRGYVGAWRIGKVIDTKAAKMPAFTGGPPDTGFRINVNVCIEWWDMMQIAKHINHMQELDPDKEILSHSALQWPTVDSGTGVNTHQTLLSNTGDLPVKEPTRLEDERLTDEQFRKREKPDVTDNPPSKRARIMNERLMKAKLAVERAKAKRAEAVSDGDTVLAQKLLKEIQEAEEAEKRARIPAQPPGTWSRAVQNLPGTAEPFDDEDMAIEMEVDAPEPTPAAPTSVPVDAPVDVDVAAATTPAFAPAREASSARQARQAKETKSAGAKSARARSKSPAKPTLSMPTPVDEPVATKSVAAATATATATAAAVDESDDELAMLDPAASKPAPTMGSAMGSAAAAVASAVASVASVVPSQKTSLRRRARNSPSPSPGDGDSSETGSSLSSSVFGDVGASASKTSLRRTVRNSPSPSPGETSDSSSDIGASIAAPKGGSPVGERRAIASSAGRRARAAAAATGDVISSIFGGGGASDAVQPLNPSHRSDGATSSAARSFSRRRPRE